MIYDISIAVSETTEAYPGDRPFKLHREKTISCGDGYELTSFEMSSHLGTHYDAPAHFIFGGKTIDQIPLDYFIGPAIVADLSDAASDIIYPENIMQYAGSGIERLLIKTGGSEKFLSESAAGLIAGSGMKILGIDRDCFECPDENGDFTIHKILLASGVLLLECLNLKAVTSGKYEFYGPPLNVFAAEAAPARVMLRD